MSICPKVLYDNKKSNFIIYYNQKNKNAINYRYQGPRSGLTNVFTLNPFFRSFSSSLAFSGILFSMLNLDFYSRFQYFI